jgi:two-component system LytT family sensor kinase
MKIISVGGLKIKKNLKSMTIHILTWLLILLINFTFLENYVMNLDLKYHILTWLVYIIVFYINYSLLIPKFLIKKKLLYFISGSIIILSVAFFVNRSIDQNQFITVFKQISSGQGTDFHRPSGFKPAPLDSARPPFPFFDREVIRRPTFDMMIKNMPPREGAGGPGFRRELFPLYGLILIYFASLSIKVLMRLREDEKKKNDIMKERISTELLYLKQQVNPHFLFNTLNNIYALSIKRPEITPAAILKISTILRYTLYESDNTLAFLKDEIEIIDSYIEFQKMRFKGRIPINFKIEGSINNYKIEPFILLPLIENACKYGLTELNNSNIDIRITIKSNIFEFKISNQKSIIGKSEITHSGIGLKNIRRRLDLVYPGNHEFIIEDGNQVFSVFLKLPLLDK